MEISTWLIKKVNAFEMSCFNKRKRVKETNKESFYERCGHENRMRFELPVE